MAFDGVCGLAETEAAPFKGFSQGFERFDTPVSDGFIGQGPETLGGLEFGRIGRLEEQGHAVWRRDVIADMPAGVVDHHDDDFILAGADLAGEGLEGFLEGRGVDGVEQEPDHLAF